MSKSEKMPKGVIKMSKSILNSGQVKETAKTYVKGYYGTNAIVPNITLLGSSILVSTHNEPSKILSNPLMSTKQVVVAVGDYVTGVKVGDWVEIDPEKFPKTSKPGPHDLGNVIKVHPPIEDIDDEKYLLVSTNHIKYIYKSKIL